MLVRKKRWGVAACATLLPLSLLTGCGASTNVTSSTNEAASASTPVTITIWDNEQGPMQQIAQTATNAFNTSQHKIKANIIFFSNDAYKQKIQIAMGANTPPDLIYGWGGGILKTYVDAHKVIPLDTFLKANPAYKNKFFPSVWGNVTINGHIYGVPEGGGTQPEFLFYNKDIFKQYDLPVPATWNQLINDVKALKNHGVIPIALGARDEWPDLMWLMYLTDRIGGPSVFNGIIANKPNAWDNPAIIKAVQMIQQLVKMGAFEPGYSGVSADSNEDQALLYSGRAAMLLQGSWIYPTLQQAAPQFTANQLGWTMFPSVPGGKGNPADLMGNISTYYYISSTSKYPWADETYLKDVVLNSYMVNQELKNGVVPPVKGLGAKVRNQPDGRFLYYAYTQAEKAPVFVTGWDQLLPPQEAQTLLQDLSSVFLLKMTPQQFVQSMNSSMPRS
ncbi:ABC transporter substrate-binding protein [Alicyclobacillus sendaiensis]|uniref:ABC transporter substrate-binding protein n=1 Tax=Alicyclobacillus sendaiensis TaxID=192387 RepID=UPI000780CBBE|nr:extracellular solute-binding protein [Alicyclobacillus sendaiensis]